MEIRPIPDVVRSALRSGSNLLTIPHCINELIYNAIDAEAKCVEIRVDLSDFQFQVIDDGNGISKSDLNLIGTRYMSSKCYNLSDYTNNSKYYGFRGETLCSLISVCQSVTIHTRLKNSDETYRKCFVNGFNSNNIENDSISRPSHGTSVIVNGWMKNLPVRQKQVSPIFDMVEIKTQIEKIALINPSISFSLRNNSNKHLMLSIRRCNNILNSINLIIGKDITANLKYVNFEHGNVKISGYISGKALPKCDVQLIYLNRRFIKRSRIHKYLRGVFSNCDLLSENPVYFLHFECPYAEFEMVYKESSIRIVFKHPEKVLKYTDKTVIKLLTDENLMNKIDKKSSNSVRGSENCSRIGITQFDTILKSKIATKSSETSKKLVSHSQVEQKDEQSNEKINDFEKLNTDYQSSIVVINKNIDYRQQYVENLTNSQKTQEKAQITDDDVFKTPTVPPLRKSITKRTSKFQKDYTQPFQNKLNTQSTMKTYDSHAKNFQNRAKTKKIIPVYTAAGTSSNEDMTPKTKVSKWLNNLEQGNDNNLVKDSENNQVQIKPKRIIKRRRSIDICEKENTDGPLDFQMQVDSINSNENYNIRDTKGADMSSKKIKVFNDNTRFSENNSKIHSKNKFTPMEESLRNQENSFEISFRLNSDQIERKFYSSDDKSEIEIITPKPPNFHRQTNNNISKNQTNITTSSKNFQIQHAFENHTRNNATLIDLSTPINCNQLVKAKKMEEKSELKFNFTPYPAEIPKLFDSLSDSFKFVMPQSILNESIVKPTSVTIASKHSSYHYQEVPKDTNFQENSHNNSFILNNYFDQYAQANSNSVLENPIQDDIVSDVNETEFEKGLDNIITSTAKTSYSKKESEQKFQLIQRLDVIPKGMSQIYDDTNTCICRHLSPRTKKELFQKIKRKYEQKLNFDRDLESYGQIFDKRFGGIRQQIKISMTKKSKISRTYSFSKSMFNKLKILSQIDKKFIATFLEPTFTENGIFILFDQHAVHERIRLERLLKDYEKLPGISKATKLDNILIFNLDSNKKEIMKNFRVNFENHGFIYTITDNSVNIISIPTCIFNKSCRELVMMQKFGLQKNSNRNNLMATLTMTLINELIDFCLDTNGVTNFFPQTVLTIINSEACRGATKFGDELSLDECKLYIHQLSKCSLPFQCAHGRPTLVPIFEVNSIKKNYKVMKINFQNIMKQK